MSITAYFDGACFPNPGGIASAGVYITDGKDVLLEDGVVIGEGEDMNSNVAEYAALIRVLEFLAEDYADAKITVKGDSIMVIRQIQGRWKIKAGRYVEYARQARALAKRFSDISFKWIPREHNVRCDALAELAAEGMSSLIS